MTRPAPSFNGRTFIISSLLHLTIPWSTVVLIIIPKPINPIKKIGNKDVNIAACLLKNNIGIAAITNGKITS